MNSDLMIELLQVPTMTLATSGAGGEPHAAAVYFAADEELAKRPPGTHLR